VDAKCINTVFDHTSLLKYATRKWGLGPLGKRVADADSFYDELQKRTSPRGDCVASINVPSAKPVDGNVALNGHQVALAGFTHHLEINHSEADTKTIAENSMAMAKDFISQSKAVASRVLQFLENPKGI
jgi:hypothetical protein